MGPLVSHHGMLDNFEVAKGQQIEMEREVGHYPAHMVLYSRATTIQHYLVQNIVYLSFSVVFFSLLKCENLLNLNLMSQLILDSCGSGTNALCRPRVRMD